MPTLFTVVGTCLLRIVWVYVVCPNYHGFKMLMSLSMVVIAAMIAAGGLGEIVLKGITQMKIGLGFEGGIAVVILAIILDRITQGLGKQKKGK
jgi:ABC-type proline/glycine betaine transport system permease subunit